MKNSDWNYPFDKPHSWDRYDEGWYLHYLELKAYKKVYGDCKVPRNWAKNKTLANWVRTQRGRKNKMVSWRRELLDALGFTWRISKSSKKISWEAHYTSLVAFYQETGHCKVAASQNRLLEQWVVAQRRNYKRGRLNPEKITLLDLVDFKKSFQEDPKIIWQRRYSQLKEFKEKHGHCNVTRTHQNKQLARWVETQRGKADKLPAEYKNLLNAIGFIWSFPKPGDWEGRISELTKFKAEFGHCRVPHLRKKTKWRSLGYWVNTQRSLYQTGKLNTARISELEHLGFEWIPIESAWHQAYQKLVSYHKKHGHCEVNIKDADNKYLGGWVRTQRKNRVRLPQRKVDLLDKLGFSWRVAAGKSASSLLAYQKRGADCWMRRFKELEAFREKNGHCNVPKTENKPLGQWVIHQRFYRKRNRLSKDRIDLLSSIGFEWSRRGKENK